MSENISQQGRAATDIDRVAEGWVATLVGLDPTVATWIGIPGRHGEFADLSPSGHEQHRIELAKVLAELKQVVEVDAIDAVTRADLTMQLSLESESIDAGLWMCDLNVIDSPAQHVREIFDLMPTTNEEEWSYVALRLHAVPAAIDGYIASLTTGIQSATVPARRQVLEVIDQARRTGAADGFFPSFVDTARTDSAQLSEGLVSDLRSGATRAAEAYRHLGDFLHHDLLPAADSRDAVGRDVYRLQSRRFLGTDIDLDATYQWGIEELGRMVEEQRAAANEIEPGASVEEVILALEADPDRKVTGTTAFQEWMQQISDQAVDELGREHFEIPSAMRTLECRIAPTQDGGVYYTSPSDDFSRPGRMWWSVPRGVAEFDTWREKTTVYHEGVPGHHLQLGRSVFNSASLNTWRRQLAGTSGHAEGWALYAERLMHDLGYLDDPADRLGMLDGQRMRAARVVLDLGVHLEKRTPDNAGVWDWDYALDFMGRNVTTDAQSLKFEVNRYFGWPGQAPAYKVGQRVWEEVRDAYKARRGTDFAMKEFHTRALDLGGVGLDTLRHALLS